MTEVIIKPQMVESNLSRFQQWAQNRASIPTLDTLPKKWMVIDNESVTFSNRLLKLHDRR